MSRLAALSRGSERRSGTGSGEGGKKAAAFGTSAVTLRRRDSSDPLDPGWRGKDGYYMKGDGVYCQKCPAGTYIAEECKEQNGSGRCEPCAYGEYMEYPNAFQWCRDCLKCREDQVERSPCQPVRNTVCACRNGTFCPPDHPCEMCQKCRPRCPEGQEVLKPCTPDSDLQCGPATNTGPLYLWVIAAVGVLTLLVIVFCLWKHHCSSPGDGRPSSRRPYEMETPSGSTKKSLVPAPGHDPIQVLRRSFYVFARKVSKDNWKKFGRSLDLEENDVIMATSDDGFYEMLYKWLSREGSKSSVNTLLETLDRLHLGGVAEDISSTLVQDGLFQYETS
ncbi:tumor necrosis factor receptor superfamily member 10A-like isoform X6 [Poecile atricapillus]|uniref:tumor necrosis factor receptor superfamily member 10A-like isoform X6 n=1 Tax=Poecile atricapillus TaxID=48891 RepID=UPI002739BD74|nr:tumor necrosis factor receptor superfamily member 10A-like isoform X6 [Poecile atricapillus]